MTIKKLKKILSKFPDKSEVTVFIKNEQEMFDIEYIGENDCKAIIYLENN